MDFWTGSASPLDREPRRFGLHIHSPQYIAWCSLPAAAYGWLRQPDYWNGKCIVASVELFLIVVLFGALTLTLAIPAIRGMPHR